jgi:hypothetical protein
MAVKVRHARKVLATYRGAEGFKAVPMKLLTAPDENLKLRHSDRVKVAGFGLSLAPADMSGYQCCRYATKGCRSACLATSGNGRYGSTQRGRIWRTKFLAEQPALFLRLLVAEIDAIKVDAWTAAGWQVSFRFNVLSDLPWETIAPWIVTRLRARGIAVYDYSKWPTARRDRAVAADLGYVVVDSVHEGHSDADIVAMPNPVVVLDIKRSQPIPATYLGRPTVDADIHDARFLPCEQGTVRVLRYKEVQTTKRAAALAGGFVRAVA